MEKLIESIPKEREMNKNPDGTINYAGLCIRWSRSERLWIAGYGRKQNSISSHTGSGHTIIEAVDDLKTKLEI